MQKDKLISAYQNARTNFNLGLITFNEYNRLINTTEFAWRELGYELKELYESSPTNYTSDISEPVSFIDVKVGDEVYVEPAFSGPFSGEGWEKVTKVQPSKFKAGNQWFSTKDGSPVTGPWAYHVSRIK